MLFFWVLLNICGWNEASISPHEALKLTDNDSFFFVFLFFKLNYTHRPAGQETWSNSASLWTPLSWLKSYPPQLAGVAAYKTFIFTFSFHLSSETSSPLSLLCVCEVECSCSSNTAHSVIGLLSSWLYVNDSFSSWNLFWWMF